MSAAVSVTASVLAGEWPTLSPAVRAVHERRPQVLIGRATVRRGRHWLARVIARLACLPQAQHEAPLRVELQRQGEHGERWVRHFGHSAPMISTLVSEHATIMERLGPTRLRYRLVAEGGAIRWQVLGATTLFVSWPRRWLDGIHALEAVRDGEYFFDVGLVLPWIGLVFRYEGSLTPA